MIIKPKQLGSEYADQFKDYTIADAYQFRFPYPNEVFEILTSFITDKPSAILDVGCGVGDIARRMINIADRVDAVDFSKYMIEKGRKLPGGDHPNLKWIHSNVENAKLSPPYNLVTAGSSLHWMNLNIVLTLFQEVLIPQKYLAIITRENVPTPWDRELRRLIRQFSTNQNLLKSDFIGESAKHSMFHFHLCDIVQILEEEGLFLKYGEKLTEAVPFVQSVNDYIASFHSRNGLSFERMGKEAAFNFDKELKNLILSFSNEEKLELHVSAKVVWGLPGYL